MRRSPSPSHWPDNINQFDCVAPSPVSPAVTGLYYPSPVDSYPEHKYDRSSSRPVASLEQTTDHSESTDSAEYRDLDTLWDTIRQKNEMKMAREVPKVESLAGMRSAERTPMPSPPPRLKRQKSMTNFRHLEDGTSVATFDFAGLSKDDVHVAFQRDRLIVTWEEVHCAVEKDGQVIRERRERTSRTIPLPAGTKFDQIRAAMGSRHLKLKYPSMRSALA